MQLRPQVIPAMDLPTISMRLLLRRVPRHPHPVAKCLPVDHRPLRVVTTGRAPNGLMEIPGNVILIEVDERPPKESACPEIAEQPVLLLEP
jgi:hypothetical protein